MTIALILQRGCLEVAAPGQKKKSDIVLSNFRESWVFRPRSIIMRFWEFSYFRVRFGYRSVTFFTVVLHFFYCGTSLFTVVLHFLLLYFTFDCCTSLFYRWTSLLVHFRRWSPMFFLKNLKWSPTPVHRFWDNGVKIFRFGKKYAWPNNADSRSQFWPTYNA